MQTTLPILLEWEAAPGEREWSPTGITGFLECQRKWGWKKIAKLSDPPGAGADLGGRAHRMWERYLLAGARPDFVLDKEAAGVASLTLHLLPLPMQPGMLLEQHFRFKSKRTGLVYHGFKDVEIAPGFRGVPSLGLDGSVPIVIDHKTTKSIDDWAKEESDLQDDAQAVLYGLDAMARFDAPAADLAWIYAQTKGAKRAKPVITRLHREQALKVFGVIEEVAAEANSVLEAGLQPLDLPPNPDACKSFGGCPYQHLCNLSPSQKIRSRMSNSLIANLRARVQGAPVSTTTGQAPSVDSPLSDRDVHAPTEILGAVNPPESELPPPVQATDDIGAKEAGADKPKRTRRTNAQIAADNAAKDPKGADAHAHAVTNPPRKEGEDLSPAQCDGQAAADRGVEAGFTLYVDCIPIGRPAKAAASLIERAQERMLEVHGVPDYRLVDFGKGTPYFISFVDEQVDGTFDLALDTRTPEGAILLETLSAKASFVVRGLR